VVAACNSGLCGGSCTPPQGLCSARSDGGTIAHACTDTRTDPQNCGGCGNVCLPQQTCSASQCTACRRAPLECLTATPGFTACLAVPSDNNICGGCGGKCAAGSSCQDGACVAAGKSNCGNADGGAAFQADLQNDRANCGACGLACVAGE